MVVTTQSTNTLGVTPHESVNHSVIKHEMGLLNLAEELQNISQACRVMGVSRDTFYRVKEAKESGGLEALPHKDRRRPNPKNRVDELVEQAVLAYALENPAAGQVRVSNELRKKGTFVSPTGVRWIWLRHTLHTFRLRLTALEKKVAEKRLLLTEAQVAALDRTSAPIDSSLTVRSRDSVASETRSSI